MKQALLRTYRCAHTLSREELVDWKKLTQQLAKWKKTNEKYLIKKKLVLSNETDENKNLSIKSIRNTRKLDDLDF